MRNRPLILGLLLILLSSALRQSVLAASDPNRSFSTYVDDSSIGDTTWTNPSRATSQNNSYASADVVDVGNATHYLKGTAAGFGLTAGSHIDGIVLEVDKYESAAFFDGKDNAVRIVKNGTIGTSDRSSAVAWPTSDTDTYVSYGSATDLWGETWTATDINSSTFGFALSAKLTCPSSCAGVFIDDVFVDHARMTVYYSSGALVNTASRQVVFY